VKKLLKNNDALVFELLIAAAMAIVILFALLNIGTYINGTIGDSLEESSTSDDVNATLETISTGYGDTLDIMVIAALVTVITIPLAAVVAVKRLM